jgi:hypothetical protein
MVFLPASTSHIYIYCTHESKASASLPAWLVAVVQTIVVDGIAIACRHGDGVVHLLLFGEKGMFASWIPENGPCLVGKIFGKIQL